VMHTVLVEIHKRFGTTWYNRPNGIVSAKVHPLTGKQSPNGVAEWFLENNLSPREQSSDLDAAGRVKLGAEYSEWFASRDNTLGNRAVLDPARAPAVRVLSPLPGTVFFLDPDLPDTSRQVRLRVNTANAQWTSGTLKCIARDDGVYAYLLPGRHRLTAIVNGQRLETWIDVEEL